MDHKFKIAGQEKKEEVHELALKRDDRSIKLVCNTHGMVIIRFHSDHLSFISSNCLFKEDSRIEYTIKPEED